MPYSVLEMYWLANLPDVADAVFALNVVFLEGGFLLTERNLDFVGDF